LFSPLQRRITADLGRTSRFDSVYTVLAMKFSVC